MLRRSSLGLLAPERSQNTSGETVCSGSPRVVMPSNKAYEMNELGQCEALANFYGKVFKDPTPDELKTFAKLVATEAAECDKSGRKLNNDFIGKLVLENIESYAKSKGVYEFISKDERPIPEIPSVSEYQERAMKESRNLAFLISRQRDMSRFDKMLGMLDAQILRLERANQSDSDKEEQISMTISEINDSINVEEKAGDEDQLKLKLEQLKEQLETIHQAKLERGQQMLTHSKDLMKIQSDKDALKSEVIKAEEEAIKIGTGHHEDNIEAVRRLQMIFQSVMDLTRIHIAHYKFLEKVLGGEQSVNGEIESVMKDGNPRSVIILLERSFRGVTQDALVDSLIRMGEINQQSVPNKRFFEVMALMNSEVRVLQSLGFDNVPIAQFAAVWAIQKMMPEERSNWNKRCREASDKRREKQILMGYSTVEMEEKFPEVSIGEKISIYANSDQLQFQTEEHRKEKAKPSSNTQGSNSPTKTQAFNRNVLAVTDSKIDQVLRFAKSSGAAEKLQGQWCYHFMSSRGCKRAPCSFTHVEELGGTDLCVEWLTRGSCKDGDKCTRRGWHKDTLSGILTKTKGANFSQTSGAASSTTTSSQSTKAKFAAAIKPIPTPDDDKSGWCNAIISTLEEECNECIPEITLSTDKLIPHTDNTMASVNLSAAKVAKCLSRSVTRILHHHVKRQVHNNVMKCGVHKGKLIRSSINGRGRNYFMCNVPGSKLRRKSHLILEHKLRCALVIYEISARFLISEFQGEVLQRLRFEKQWQATIRELKISNNCWKIYIPHCKFPKLIRIPDENSDNSTKFSRYQHWNVLARLSDDISSIRSEIFNAYETNKHKKICFYVEAKLKNLQQQSKNVESCDNIFAILESDVHDDSEGLNPVNAISKPLIPGEDVTLMWDAGSCYTILQHKAHFTKIHPYHQTVVGLAGKRQITHRGEAHSAFGLTHRDAVFINNSGGLPNIMSVSQENKVDSAGRQGATLYLGNIAFKFRVSEELNEIILQLLTLAEESNMMTGTATMEHGVYVQRINGEGRDTTSYQNISAPVTSMFNRVPLSSNLEAVGMLAAAGYPQTTLQAFAAGLVKGWPQELKKPDIDLFFNTYGRDNPALKAHITRCPCHKVLDYEKNIPTKVGEFLQIDAIVPSLAYVPGAKAQADKPAIRGRYEPSAQGYNSYVRAIDPFSGVAVGQGRASKEDPHEFIEEFCKLWIKKWDNQLTVLFTDDEFVTHESARIFSELVPHGRIRQPPPAEHNRGLQCIEGSHRAFQDRAQASMNRGLPLVEIGLLTDRQHRSLWYEAFQLAEFVDLGAPAWHDKTVTKYEIFHKCPYNFSEHVILPFLTPMVCRRIHAGRDGRGDTVYYLRPSQTAIGSIRSFDPKTSRIRIVYSFLPRDNLHYSDSWDYVDIANRVYQHLNLKEVEELLNDASPTLDVHVGTRIVDALENISTNQGEDKCEDAHDNEVEEEVYSEAFQQDEQINETNESSLNYESSQYTESLDENKFAEENLIKDQATEVTKSFRTKNTRRGKQQQAKSYNPYFTSARTGRVIKTPNHLGEFVMLAQKWLVVAVTVRPPKPPILLNKRQMKLDPKWIASDKREVDKLLNAGVMLKLPRDQSGKYILPEDFIKLRLIELHEFKWKPDPVTGEEGYLECTRIVCDGSCDTREETNNYAECPDRTILHTMTSIDSVQRAWVYQGDIQRAYLHAPSLDRNIVVVTASIPAFGESLMLLDKGLYGARKSALSFQVWADDKLEGLNYKKMNIAKSIYVKRVDDVVIRIYRHSDDFRVSCTNLEKLLIELKVLESTFDFGEKGFTPFCKFLGCEYERLDMQGNQCANGQITLVRCVEKIEAMALQYADLRSMFSIGSSHQYTPLPTNPLRGDDHLDEEMRSLLDTHLIRRYMSLVGSIGYVACSVRLAARFSHFVLARRLQSPRRWDLYMAVWTLEYLISTKEMPLVLGGESYSLQVICDASLGSLPDRRSIGAHVLSASSKSGACYVRCSAIKSVVVTVFEAELNAYVEGLDTMLYVMHACDEMLYMRSGEYIVRTDSESTLNWMESGISSRQSRHIDLRLQRTRQIILDGEIMAGYVESKENMSDLFTKHLDIKQTQYLTFLTMGHGLVKHLIITGIEFKF